MMLVILSAVILYGCITILILREPPASGGIGVVREPKNRTGSNFPRKR